MTYYESVDKVNQGKGGFWKIFSQDDAKTQIKIEDEPEDSDSAGSKHNRPKMSFAWLIAEALHHTKGQNLRLSEIYHAISGKHPYYRIGQQAWQNSIRHNLSLKKDKYFKYIGQDDLNNHKTSDEPSQGRGGLWMLLPKGEEMYQKGLKRLRIFNIENTSQAC